MTPSEYIDRHAADIPRRLQALVRVPTVNPPGADYDQVTAWLTLELTALGLRTRRFALGADRVRRHLPREQWEHPRFNVLGKLTARGARKTVHFNAHYDVVPVSGRWRHGSPFSGTVEGEWIYGRGTADMKGSMASLMLALQALRATRTEPRVNVEVSFTADEETDSVLGASWLVRHAPIEPDYALVMEGGEGGRVCCGHNGVIWLEVSVHGRAAHGSTPERGINALEKMAALVLGLRGYKRRLARKTLTTPEGAIMRPTVNVGGVFSSGSGGKINTVPAYASFSIDRRVLPGEDHDEAERDLRLELGGIARSIPDCRIAVRKVSENFACFTEPTDPFFSAVSRSVGRVRGRPATFSVSTGFNDMHFFAHHLRIPTAGYGPGGQRIHAVDERARLKDLLQSAKIYADLLTNFAG